MKTLLALSLALVISAVHAEVLELEGTVTAVNIDARTITVERKTPSGTRTLTLEVAEKVGDSADLKPGSRISFSYDPDLEIVTRIASEAGSNDKPESATPQSIDRYIASFSISRDGQATLITGPSPGPTAFTANQQGIARTQSSDGTWDSVYVFDGPQVIDAFEFARGVEYEPDTCMIRLSRDAKRNQAAFVARELLAAPCLIEWEGPVTVKPAAIRIRLSGSAGAGMAAVSISGIRKGSKAAIKATVTPAATTNGKSPASVDLCEAAVPLDEQARHDFQLPKSINPNGLPWMVYVIGSVDDDNTSLTRLRIKGHVSFNWGIKWDSRKGGAYVLSVSPKSVAERVGIQEGDLVLSIGDCRPDSAEAAQRCLSDVTFDQEISVKVKTADATRTLTVKEPWDRDH